MRFDPDYEGDMACDDEMAGLRGTSKELPSTINPPISLEGIASVSSCEPRDESDLALAPYRVIGDKRASPGGAGGGAAPPATSRWLFYHTDHLGSPRVIADKDGHLVSQHHFMPFGDEKPIALRVSSNASMFTGHERDVESTSSDNPDGLDYMKARYCSSSFGRFMTVDPVAESIVVENPLTWNRYTYTLSNPLRYVDPFGLWIMTIGPSRDEYLAMLSKKTGFKLKYDKKGRVAFDGKAPAQRSLSGANAEVYKAIEGKEEIQINTTRDDATVDFDKSTGRGEQTIDFGDAKRLDNPSNHSIATSENLALHATLEAYGTARGQSETEAHRFASSLSFGLSMPPADFRQIVGGGFVKIGRASCRERV